MLTNYYNYYQTIKWKIKITTKSPLHIGSGSSDGGKQDAKKVIRVLMNGTGYPYIPGSSLKGVLRSEIERYLRTSNKLFACDPLQNSCGKNLRNYRLAKMNHEELKKYLVLRKSENETGICLACDLFGSQVMKGTTKISDFVPNKLVPIQEKTSTAITRDNGNVARGALFTIEYVPPNQEFFGEITIMNYKDKLRIGYLAAGLLNLNQNLISLGAFTTKGFGKVSIEITEKQISNGLDKPKVESVDKTSSYLREFIKTMEGE